jgi:succinyl-CoA synthetase alpha subunit
MGHPEAIISGNRGTAQSKVEALPGAGETACDTIDELVAAAKAKAGTG